MNPSRFLHRKLHHYSHACRRAHGTAALRGGWNLRSAATLCSSSRQPVLGIRREESSVWERRAPLNPNHVQSLVKEGVKVLIQPSTRRAYSMHEYEVAGAVIRDDITEADTIIGVKQPPLSGLIEDKTYVFFSHTIKAQPENMPLLDALLQKGIRLVDYEKILNEEGLRLVAFGKYAGVSGMINILHGLGLRMLALGHHTPFMHVGTAHNYASSGAAKAAIANLGHEIEYGLMPEVLGPLIFTFTGTGNVSQGAQEVFEELPNEFVPPTDLQEVAKTGDTRKVYATVVSRKDYLVRKESGATSDAANFDVADFDAHMDQYKSTFFDEIAPYTTCLINGGYWGPGMPRLITTEQCKQLHPRELDVARLTREGVPELPQRLLAIADISCDLEGSLEFMKECSTVDYPFLLYNAHTQKTSHNMSGNGIVMMSLDNLPVQLPREATNYFGSKLLPFIKHFLKLDGRKPLKDCEDVDKSVRDAVITYNGHLTERFEYIAELRKKNEQSSK